MIYHYIFYSVKLFTYSFILKNIFYAKLAQFSAKNPLQLYSTAQPEFVP